METKSALLNSASAGSPLHVLYPRLPFRGLGLAGGLDPFSDTLVTLLRTGPDQITVPRELVPTGSSAFVDYSGIPYAALRGRGSMNRSISVLDSTSAVLKSKSRSRFIQNSLDGEK